jgi:hypothetical protein
MLATSRDLCLCVFTGGTTTAQQEATAMDIESIFAAEIFNAEKTAAEQRKYGFPCTTSDVIQTARSDLWMYDSSRAHDIETKYICWDADENPQKRTDIAWGNVVAFA